jgi:hypothetical protein
MTPSLLTPDTTGSPPNDSIFSIEPVAPVGPGGPKQGRLLLIKNGIFILHSSDIYLIKKFLY